MKDVGDKFLKYIYNRIIEWINRHTKTQMFSLLYLYNKKWEKFSLYYNFYLQITSNEWATLSQTVCQQWTNIKLTNLVVYYMHTCLYNIPVWGASCPVIHKNRYITLIDPGSTHQKSLDTVTSNLSVSVSTSCHSR